MPPKRAVMAATGPRRSTRTKHQPELFSNSELSVSVKAPAGKRKADSDAPEQPAAKRGRPAKPTVNAPATHRGRGRPKKDAAPAATRRGPGRPKKDAATPATTSARGPGRPKKGTTTAAPATTTSTGRGRGRPPKNAAAPPTSTATRAKKTPVSRKASAAATKVAPTSTTTAKAKPVGRKPPTPRTMHTKRASEEVDQPEQPVAKKHKAAGKSFKAAPSVPSQPAAPVLALQAPTETLTILLTGQGDSGELGMGVGKPGINAKRPRLNKNLLRDVVGVVQLAAGGMHCAALTHDNIILTWGVNDQGALGRNTEWNGGLKDMNADEDSDSEDGDGDLNPHEATPAAVDSKHFPPGTIFVQVVAGDSATFALTSDGKVYGWGTFRDNQGVLGFTKKDNEQRTPILIESLEDIKSIACGNNFALALTSAGTIFSWGAGQQNQLGRDVSDDERYDALRPHQLNLDTEITSIFAGSDHSFAIAKDGKVYSWGLNNFGQCGITASAGDSSAVVRTPTIVDQLGNDNIAMLAGGTHHSLAVSHDGDCLAWGRTDKSQMGFDVTTMPEDQIARSESTNKVALLKVPTVIPGLPPKSIKHVAAGSDHSIAVTQDGLAYSWGFSAQFETGQGTDDDVENATLLSNTALQGQRVAWAGCGGQFSVLATIPAESQAAGGSSDIAAPVTATATGANSGRARAKTPVLTLSAPAATNGVRARSGTPSASVPTSSGVNGARARSKTPSASVPASSATLGDRNNTAFAHNQNSTANASASTNGAPAGAWAARHTMTPLDSDDGNSSDSDEDRRPVGPQSPLASMNAARNAGLDDSVTVKMEDMDYD